MCVCVCVCVCVVVLDDVHIYTIAAVQVGYVTRSIFKRSRTALNSEFSFSLTGCLNKAKESSLPYYLSVAGGRIVGFIPFPRVLALREM